MALTPCAEQCGRPICSTAPRKQRFATVGSSSAPYFAPTTLQEDTTSAGDWQDLFWATVDGNLPLVEPHIREKVKPNYQTPSHSSHASGGHPSGRPPRGCALLANAWGCPRLGVRTGRRHAVTPLQVSMVMRTSSRICTARDNDPHRPTWCCWLAVWP